MISINSNDFKRRILSGEVFTDNLKVNGSLYLNNCTSLKSLPDNLKVSGNLYLNNCTSLKSLPDNLEVGDIIYCDRDLIDRILLIDLPIYFNFHFEDSIKSYLLKILKKPKHKKVYSKRS